MCEYCGCQAVQAIDELTRDFAEQIEGLRNEHALVHGVLDDVSLAGAGADRSQERLLDALTVLRLHILKEQDGVFPAALSRSGPTDWDALDAVRAEVGHGLAVTRP